MLKNIILIGFLGFNDLSPLTNEKDSLKEFIAMYVGLIVVHEILWKNKALQGRACTINADAGLLWSSCKTSKYTVLQGTSSPAGEKYFFARTVNSFRLIFELTPDELSPTGTLF